MKDPHDIIVSLLFATFVIVMALLVILSPGGSFSEYENRRLAERPHISDIKDGRFASGLHDFISDNLPARRTFLALHSQVELMLGKCEVNSVLVCRDGSLVVRRDAKDLDMTARGLEAVRRIAELAKDGGTRFFVALIPEPICSKGELLPLCYQTPAEELHVTENKWLTESGIATIDTASAILKTPDAYYRTDHHLTSAGAFAAYKKIASALGYTPHDESDFDFSIVSDHFLGTTHSRAALPVLRGDIMLLPRFSGDEEFTSTWDGGELNSFYDFSYLDVKDKYSVFFGGNHAKVNVTEGAERDRILIIKDSYANAIVPMLARHADITMIDPRSYRDDLQIKDGGYSAVVLLCGADFIESGESLIRLAASCF